MNPMSPRPSVCITANNDWYLTDYSNADGDCRFYWNKNPMEVVALSQLVKRSFPNATIRLVEVKEVR